MKQGDGIVLQNLGIVNCTKYFLGHNQDNEIHIKKWISVSRYVILAYYYVLLLPCQEGSNSDSALMSLRAALQSIEKAGMVDYTVGGHSCRRPAAVEQGHAEDHFEISPDGSNALLWRANQIPTKNLKSSNVASHFTFENLRSSPLKLVPGTHQWWWGLMTGEHSIYKSL